MDPQTKMKGEHLGGSLLDMAKPDTETPAVSLALGDISITLTDCHEETMSIIDSTRIAGKLHYRVMFVGDPVVSAWRPLAYFLDGRSLDSTSCAKRGSAITTNWWIQRYRTRCRPEIVTPERLRLT